MKKLKNVERIVLKLKGDIKKLTKYGFRRVWTDSASGEVFIHDKKKIVVKRPCVVNSRKSPKFIIPTVIIRIPHKSYRYQKVFIQPKANRNNTRLARIRLTDMGYNRADHKAANCGWYRRKPVLIDW